MNVLLASFRMSPDGGVLQIGDQVLRMPASAVAARPALLGFDGRDVAVGIRPERLEDAEFASDSEHTHSTHTIVGRVSPLSRVDRGHTATLSVKVSELHLFDLSTGSSIV